MSKNNKNNLDDLVFKPLMLKNEVGDRLIIIYSHDNHTEQVVSPRGSVIKRSSDAIKIFDISRTLEYGRPILEIHQVNSKKEFREMVEAVSLAEHIEEIMAAVSIVAEEMMATQSKLDDMGMLVSAIKRASKSESGVALPEDEGNDQGNLVFAGSQEPLAHIVFKTISGEDIDLKKALSKEDIQKIGSVLMEIIFNNTEADLSSNDFLRRLRAEIEYKIVDSLPPNLKAGDIHINMEGFIEEIKRHKGPSEEGKSEE